MDRSPMLVDIDSQDPGQEGKMETDKAGGRGEGVCFSLPVRDGLLECPNCGGDHFTTLRVPQKNLFNSTLAQPGRTGLVLTGLPPFIVTTVPINSLLLPWLYWHCGSLRDTLRKHMCARFCTNTCKQECKCACTNAQGHMRSHIHLLAQPAHTFENSRAYWRDWKDWNRLWW